MDERIVELGEQAWVLPLRTPTLPPATTTNVVVAGGKSLVVIEPATPHPEEQRVLDGFLAELAARGQRVTAILLTHHHSDHIGYADALRQRLGVPLCAHAETAARLPFEIDRELEHGDTIEAGDLTFTAVHTPGHAPGHLVYSEANLQFAHAGDMVAGEGTILIDPEDSGDMGQYLESLEVLRRLELARLVPAHGPVIQDPPALLHHYVRHRLGREAKVLAALGPEPRRTDDVLAVAYADTPRHVWPLAARSLEAHLVKLEVEGRVRRDGDTITLTDV